MATELYHRIDAIYRRVEAVAVAVAGCVILAVMGLVATDAVLRRGFDHPLTFQLPLSENYFLVALSMLSLAWGYRQGGSIRVHLLIDCLPRKISIAILRIGLAISSIYIMTLAVLAWATFHEALINNEVQMGVIDWPVAWSWFWIPIGCGMLSLRLALDVFKPGDELLHAGDDHSSKELTGE